MAVVVLNCSRMLFVIGDDIPAVTNGACNTSFTERCLQIGGHKTMLITASTAGTKFPSTAHPSPAAVDATATVARVSAVTETTITTHMRATTFHDTHQHSVARWTNPNTST